MRHPYNPGDYGMGCLWNYKYTKMNETFYVYTFVYDVFGVADVQFYYRIDDDGFNPIEDNANEVFDPKEHGLSGVGAWTKVSMIQRKFPKTCIYGIKCDPLPNYIADEYYVRIDSLKNVLVDYYVSATDVNGNTKNSDIYHVWVGLNPNRNPK